MSKTIGLNYLLGSDKSRTTTQAYFLKIGNLNIILSIFCSRRLIYLNILLFLSGIEKIVSKLK